MPAISVVIPAYNAEKYIAGTLDSILAQSLGDWECVVVDDGSTDGTLAIVESYAARDGRFRHTTIPNSGSAKRPRDRAIEMATGEWICGIDADDHIDGDYLGKLHDMATATGADVVLSRMIGFDEKNPRIFTIPAEDFDTKRQLTGREAVALTLGRWRISTSGALIRRNIALQTVLRQDEKSWMNRDEYDSRSWLMASGKIVFTDAGYHYRRHPDSITTRISPRLFETVMTDNLLQKEIERRYGADSGEYGMILAHRFGTLRGLSVAYYSNRRQFSPLQEREIYQSLRDNYASIDRGRTAEISSPHRKLLLYGGFGLFMFVGRVRAILNRCKRALR